MSLEELHGALDANWESVGFLTREHEEARRAAAHAVMAVAMVTMIGWHPVAPGWVPGWFTAIGLWFFALAVPPGQRLPNLHHAAMAGTTAWMTDSHHLNGAAAGVLAAYFSLAPVAWLRKPHIGHAAMTAVMAAMLLAA